MITSPEKVEQSIEALQAKVVSLDSEVVILRKAKRAGQIDIEALTNQKKELEGQVSDLETTAKEKEERVEIFAGELSKMTQLVGEKKEELELVLESIRIEIERLEKTRESFIDLERRTEAKEQKLAKLLKELRKKGSNLNILIDKSKELLKYLSIILMILVPAIVLYMLLFQNGVGFITQISE